MHEGKLMIFTLVFNLLGKNESDLRGWPLDGSDSLAARWHVGS